LSGVRVSGAFYFGLAPLNLPFAKISFAQLYDGSTSPDFIDYHPMSDEEGGNWTSNITTNSDTQIKRNF
jgi:hypothetical protein